MVTAHPGRPCRRHLGVRRLDAAFFPRSIRDSSLAERSFCGAALLGSLVGIGLARKGGVKPPHSKALRAFSCLLGGRQPTGMGDCLDNTQSEIPLPRLRDRNDRMCRVITQTRQGERATTSPPLHRCDGSPTGKPSARGSPPEPASGSPAVEHSEGGRRGLSSPERRFGHGFVNWRFVSCCQEASGNRPHSQLVACCRQ